MIKSALFFISIIFYANLVFAFETSAKQAYVVDVLGKVLLAKNENEKISPASITKIMTTIVAFDLIKKGELRLEEKFKISKKAWRMSSKGYSSMFIMPGDKVSVEDLLKGIIIVSGNDACVALAQGIAGTEEEFVNMMNSMAKKIGLYETKFSNSSGLYDENNYSTAKDIVNMSIYLINNFPKLYEYYKIKKSTWDRTGGAPITQGIEVICIKIWVEMVKNWSFAGLWLLFSCNNKKKYTKTNKRSERPEFQRERSIETIRLLSYAKTDMIFSKSIKRIIISS